MISIYISFSKSIHKKYWFPAIDKLRNKVGYTLTNTVHRYLSVKLTSHLIKFLVPGTAPLSTTKLKLILTSATQRHLLSTMHLKTILILLFTALTSVSAVDCIDGIDENFCGNTCDCNCDGTIYVHCNPNGIACSRADANVCELNCGCG